MSVFKLESDLRKKVRGDFPNAQWVEAALGGSTGLPDCFINDIDGAVNKVAFFELKLGEVRGYEIVYEVRPEQRKRIKAMTTAGYAVWFLVGEKGGERVWRIAPNGRTVYGRAWIGGLMAEEDGVPIVDLRSELLAGSLLGRRLSWK